MALNRILKHIATLGPVGYVPFAPGTFGSLAGLFSAWLSPLSGPSHLFFVIAGVVFGSFAASAAEKELGEKDSGKIVIDEFFGIFTSTLFLPKTAGLYLAAFFLFRFFDIMKPLMIKKLERTLKSGVGVMADDLLAGIYTNLLLQAFLHLSKRL